MILVILLSEVLLILYPMLNHCPECDKFVL